MYILQEDCLSQLLADHIIHYRDERLPDTTDRQNVSVLGAELKKSTAPFIALLAVAIVGIVGTIIGGILLGSEPFEIFKICVGLGVLPVLGYIGYAGIKEENRQRIAAHHQAHIRHDVWQGKK